MHITLVEDDPMNALVMKRILTKIGNYEVTLTEDVSTILDLARSGTTNLVVMDVSLANCTFNGERMDGITISRLLKTGPPPCAVPILLATAHAMRGDAQRLLAESMADGYISKPIAEPTALTEKIRGMLDDAHRTAPRTVRTKIAPG